MSRKRQYDEVSTSEEPTSEASTSVEPATKKSKWDDMMATIEQLPDLCKERILKQWCLTNLDAFKTYFEVCEAAERLHPDDRDQFKSKWSMARADRRVEGHLRIVHKHLVSFIFYFIMFFKLECKYSFYLFNRL